MSSVLPPREAQPASAQTAVVSADAAAEPLPGPFISYSRRDRAFAERLYEALRARNRDAWVDLEGIEPSEEWLRKLYGAIDAAQAFVFVISPDSVRSRHCDDEIRYAAEGNKKLIPVVWREAPDDQIPEALARIQWISFVDESHFEDAADELVRALDTDLAWNARHTRLLVRAREWSVARDRSLLLRGNDLKEAEQWLLDSGASRDRRPAGLQTEFIGASVAAEKRFRNRLLGSVTGAALLALTLAAVALYQRNVAQANERQAVSRQLAAQAQSVMSRDLGLSMLLAAAAFQRRPTFEAARALFDAARHRPHLEAFLHGHNDRVHQLTFGAQGTLLASSAVNGRIIVWDVNTLRPVYDVARTPAGGGPAVALHPARALLASAGDSGVVYLHAIHDSVADDSLHLTARVAALAFSPNGNLLAAGGSDRSLTVWSDDHPTQLCRLPEATRAPAVALRFDASGGRLAVVDESGAFRIVSLDQCAVAASIDGQAGAPAAAIDDALQTAVSADVGIPDITVFDVPAGTATVHENTTGATDYLLAVSSVGRDTFALGTAAGTVLLWSAGRPRTVRTLAGHRSDVTAISFDPLRRRLASGSMTGEVILWQLDRRGPVEPSRTIPTSAVDLAFSADGRQLVTVDPGGAVRLWDVATLAPLGDLPPWPGDRTAVAITASERVATLANGRIEVRSWRDGVLIDSLRTAGYESTQLAFSADGQRLLSIDGGRVHLRDLASRITRDIAAAAEGTSAVAFSARGDGLVFVSSRDTVVFRERESAANTYLLVPGNKGPVQSVALFGDLIVTGGQLDDGAVLIWDVPTRRVLRTLPGATRLPVARVLLSPDGRTLAAVAEYDESLNVWDVATGQPILGPIRLEGRSREAVNVAFSPDATLLATAERDGVVLRELEPTRWLRAICRAVNRNLSEDEWVTWVGDSAFQPICAELSDPARSDPARPATRRQ